MYAPSPSRPSCAPVSSRASSACVAAAAAAPYRAPSQAAVASQRSARMAKPAPAMARAEESRGASGGARKS